MTEQQAWTIFVFEPLLFVTLLVFVLAVDRHFRPYRDDTSRFKPPTHPEKPKDRFKTDSRLKKWRTSDDMLDEE